MMGIGVSNPNPCKQEVKNWTNMFSVSTISVGRFPTYNFREHFVFCASGLSLIDFTRFFNVCISIFLFSSSFFALANLTFLSNELCVFLVLFFVFFFLTIGKLFVF